MTSSARRGRRVSYLGEGALGEHTGMQVSTKWMRLQRGCRWGQEVGRHQLQARPGEERGAAEETRLTSTDTFFHKHRHQR